MCRVVAPDTRPAAGVVGHSASIPSGLWCRQISIGPLPGPSARLPSGDGVRSERDIQLLAGGQDLVLSSSGSGRLVSIQGFDPGGSSLIKGRVAGVLPVLDRECADRHRHRRRRGCSEYRAAKPVGRCRWTGRARRNADSECSRQGHPNQHPSKQSAIAHGYIVAYRQSAWLGGDDSYSPPSRRSGMRSTCRLGTLWHGAGGRSRCIIWLG